MRYVAAIEDASRPALGVQWTDASSLAIAGPVPADDLISVQVNAGQGWTATQDGREIAITQDRLGFLVLHPTASPGAKMELRYRGTTEQRVMAGVSALAWVGAIFALFKTSAKRTGDGLDGTGVRI